jgi:hypothetical protein
MLTRQSFTSRDYGLQGGVAVPRGLANVQSVLSEPPVLKFKSDKAFLTSAEVAQRTAAAAELKNALAAQIAEKEARKAAEKAADKAREEAEAVRSNCCFRHGNGMHLLWGPRFGVLT